MGRRRRSASKRTRRAHRVRRWVFGLVAVSVVFLLAAKRLSSAPGHEPASPGREHAPPVSSSGSARAPGPLTDEASPWSSPEACERLISPRPPGRNPGKVRLATWNVRWFPDGGPGKRRRGGKGPVATNLRWLACAIASLDVDALALQEIKATKGAREALAIVLAHLDRLTGGEWKSELDGCEGAGRQHVGVLYDARRLRRREGFDIATLNPKGPGACDHMLRPGHAVYFERDGGADFHFVSVHLKSGNARTDLDLRRASILALGRAHADAVRHVPDTDVVLAGDLNTMGCPRCRPKIPAREELEALDGVLEGASPPYERITPAPACSEYYRGRPALLDHFLVHRGMREVSESARAVVHGFCADAACTRFRGGRMPRAYVELSDHCPVVLELEDRDLD